MEKRKLLQGGDDLTRLGLRGEALDIALRREAGWEYRLFCQLVRQEMELHNQLRRDAQINFATQLTKRLGDPSEFAAWIENRMAAGLKILSAWNTVMEQLDEAFGPSGTPGDAALILYVASRLGKIYQSALEWKIEFHQIQVDDGFESLRAATADYMDGVPTSFDKLIAEMGALLEDFDMNHKPGERRAYELDWIVSVSPEVTARYDLEYAKFKERYPPGGN